MRTNAKKGLLNILFGIVGQAITVILAVIVPRFVIVNLGSEANGLISSVNQILIYLVILETGVGIATTQALYKPVGADNKTGISAIMAATSRYYKKTGLVYFLILLVLAVVYPLIVKSELSYFTIFIVIIFSGFPSVISYLYQAKYKLLLQVEGKKYIVTNITTIITVLTNISKIVLLSIGLDIIAVQAAFCLVNLLQTVYYAYYIKKHYGWLDLNIKPDIEAISQKNSVMVHQISALVFNHVDVVLITLFLGLRPASVYSMYAMLFTMIKTVLITFNDSVAFAMGQEYANSGDKYIKMHDTFEVCNMALTFSLFCITNIFVLPFMKLYTAGVSDISYIDKWLPYLFSAIYLMDNGRTSSKKVIEFAGHFKKTQSRAIAEMSINLIVSIIAINIFGIYGVLFGTIAALIYRANDMIIYSSKRILNRSPWITYKRWIICLIVFISITVCAKCINVDLSSYTHIILWAVIACIFIIPVFFIILFVFEKKVFIGIKSYIKPYIRKIFSKKQEN